MKMADYIRFYTGGKKMKRGKNDEYLLQCRAALVERIPIEPCILLMLGYRNFIFMTSGPSGNLKATACSSLARIIHAFLLQSRIDIRCISRGKYWHCIRK